MPARRFATAEEYRLHKNEKDRIAYANGLRKRPPDFNEKRREKYAADKADEAIELYKAKRLCAEREAKRLRAERDASDSSDNSSDSSDSSDNSESPSAPPMVPMEELKKCNDQLEQLTKHNEELKKRNDQLKKHNEELKMRNEELTKHNEELRKQHEQLVDKAKAWKKRTEGELDKQKEELTKQKEQLSKQKVQLIDQAKAWKKRTEDQLIITHVDKCFDGIFADIAAPIASEQQGDTSARSPMPPQIVDSDGNVWLIIMSKSRCKSYLYNEQYGCHWSTGEAEEVVRKSKL